MIINVFLSVFVFFNIFYIIARLKKDFSIIDTAWALSFVLIFLVSCFSSAYVASFRVNLIGVLVIIWAIRLSGYIFLRSKKIGKEDYRYAQWRKDWGNKANFIAYFKVFMLQALLALIIASPLYFIHLKPNSVPFGKVTDYIGLLIWVIGFLFESIADQQKANFKKNDKNKTKVLDKGLWKYSRHPNYFGEALLWWGVALLALAEIPLYQALVGPFILNIFLLKVSGVSLLEQKYQGNTEYDAYKNKTSAFIPWFPGKDAKH
ncbi:MAG: DUF1295 domain-containing protein [Bacteriovoracaceae bacterium]